MRTQPINVVHRTAYRLTPSTSRMPSGWWSLIKVVLKAHRIWFWFQRAKIYTNQDNFLKLIAGHTVNWTLGKNKIVRLAAQVVLITTRILDCVEEQKELICVSKKLWLNIFDKYSLPQKHKWSKSGKSMLLSPSTVNWVKEKYRTFILRIYRIIRICSEVFRRLFTFCMKSIDAVYAFSFESESSNQGMNELFVNLSKCMDALVKNKYVLLGCLKENREAIALLLSQVGSLISEEQLILAVEKTLNVAKSLHEGVEEVSKKTGSIVKDAVKRGALGVSQVLGLTHHMPDAWVPPLRLEWLNGDNEESYPRFPKKEWVQINVPPGYEYKSIDEILSFSKLKVST